MIFSKCIRDTWLNKIENGRRTVAVESYYHLLRVASETTILTKNLYLVKYSNAKTMECFLLVLLFCL